MKRISLMLALFLILSLSIAFAQPNGNGEIYTVISGLYEGNIPLNTGSVEFLIYFHNLDPVNKVKGFANGFYLTTDGGATWVGDANKAFSFNEAIHFNTTNTFKKLSWDGISPDSVTYGAASGATEDPEDPDDDPSLGFGIPPSYNDSAINITVTFDQIEANAGQIFCLDSTYFPPSGTWKWDWGTEPGFDYPTWDGPHCFELVWVPDVCPEFVNPTLTGGGDHCNVVVIQYTAVDPDATPGGVTYTKESGVGAIGATSGQYTYAPVLADVGASVGAVLGCSDAAHTGACNTVALTLNFTNQAPVFATGCGTSVPVGMGNTGVITLTGSNVDCDPALMSIIGVTPTPVGGYTFVGGVLTFNTVAPDDGGITYDFEIGISDGVDGNVCHVFFEVLRTEPFEVQIEKTHNTIQGTHVIVDVTLNKGSENMGGFDFMIAYDASALNFQAAVPGVLHTVCGWEYFNYRFGATGNCGSACPSGVLEVVAIAETNNGANHPSCLMTGPLPIVLFSLDFLVSDDRTLECMYVPIRFYWTNCTDNSIAYHPGEDPLSAVQGVSRYVIDFDLIGHIENMYTGFPTYTGVQAECLVGGGLDKPVPMQFVDFYNGGVDIVCADSIDARGDINLNGNANEIADAVLFSNYFIQGMGVFNVNYQGQVAATDVNADGLALSVADLVYLIRIIVGDALPYPKLGAEAASYAYENGVMSVDSKMGAAFVVIEGNVNPTLLADKMEMNYAFDGNNTRVLVSNIARGADFEGSFLQFEGRVVSAEFATYDGAPVAQKLVPTSFSLAQNYPNPFNGMTKIAFGMPTAGDYTLTIYNVTGQKVADFAGTSEAGMVTVDWDAANQASGVYFYKLNTDNFTDTKKMVYLK
jgi:hypothetical protein